MAWKDELHKSVVKWLNDPDNYTYITDATEVISLDQEERLDGYCETCYYEYNVVVINYRDTTGLEKIYEYQGEMTEFLRYLTD